MKIGIVILAAILFVCGCAAHVAQSVAPYGSEIKQIRQKNYTLGNEKIAHIGERIILVKEYHVLESESALQADNSFTITGGLLDATVNVSGSQGQEFPIAGSIKVKGKHCYTIEIPNSRFVFAIKPDGVFSGVVAGFTYANSPIKGVNVYKINPANTRFYPTKTKSQHVMKDAPFTNMEIIYSGLSDSTIHLLYREYTPDNLIRPAFTQEISYPSDSKTIRFRDFRIALKEASAERLVYSVTKE